MTRDEQAGITKNKILSSATQLFLEKGYDQATMQDIMDATNLSKGALYHHFKSKQEILEYNTKQEQDAVSNFLCSLVDDDTLSPKQKFESLISYLLSNDSMYQLTKAQWAEKIPFALLTTLRNTLNVLTTYIEQIIIQGNDCGEFDCKYPREISDILLLLIDIWLDPVIVNSSYNEICKKIDFIILFTEQFGVPIISHEQGEGFKRNVKSHYVD